MSGPAESSDGRAVNANQAPSGEYAADCADDLDPGHDRERRGDRRLAGSRSAWRPARAIGVGSGRGRRRRARLGGGRRARRRGARLRCWAPSSAPGCGGSGRLGVAAAVGVGAGLGSVVGRAMTTTVSSPAASVPTTTAWFRTGDCEIDFGRMVSSTRFELPIRDRGAIGLALGRTDLVDLGRRCRRRHHRRRSRPSRPSRHRPRSGSDRAPGGRWRWRPVASTDPGRSATVGGPVEVPARQHGRPDDDGDDGHARTGRRGRARGVRGRRLPRRDGRRRRPIRARWRPRCVPTGRAAARAVGRAGRAGPARSASYAAAMARHGRQPARCSSSQAASIGSSGRRAARRRGAGRVRGRRPS